MIWPNSSLPPTEGALTSPFPPLPQLSFSCCSAAFTLYQLLCSDPPLQTDSIISNPKKKIISAVLERRTVWASAARNRRVEKVKYYAFSSRNCYISSAVYENKFWSPIFTLLTEWRIHRSEYVDYVLVYSGSVFPKLSSNKNFLQLFMMPIGFIGLSFKCFGTDY